jgi:hypothetical protein
MKNIQNNIALALPGSVTPVSLQLRPDVSFDEWMAAGEKIYRVRQACHWWIGDWLIHGEAAYGEAYSQAIDDTKFAYYTLAHDKFVASRFEVCRRRQNLSWSHHEAVAGLSPAEQDKWLNRAEKHGWTRDELREEIRAIKVKGDVAGAEISPADENDSESERALAENTGSEEEENRTAVIEPEKWAVLVECDSQEEQRSLLERLTAEGLRCKGLNGQLKRNGA